MGPAPAGRRGPRAGGGRAGWRRRARRAPEWPRGRSGRGARRSSRDVRGPVLELRAQMDVLARAVDAHVDLVARLLAVDDPRDVVGALDRLAVDLRDDVA